MVDGRDGQDYRLGKHGRLVKQATWTATLPEREASGSEN